MIKWRAKFQASTKAYSYELVMDAVTAAYILPALKRERKRVADLYERYKGIHEAGEATRLQQTKMIKHHDHLLALEKIINVIEPQLVK